MRIRKEIGTPQKLNKAKGTLVPERGWKYSIIIAPKSHLQDASPGIPGIHPQSSSPGLVLRAHPYSSSSKIIPRVHPQTSSPEFSSRSVLGPGTCVKAYNLIKAKKPGLNWKMNPTKNLSKTFESVGLGKSYEPHNKELTNEALLVYKFILEGDQKKQKVLVKT